MSNLEQMVKQATKTMIISDVHVPYQDDNSINEVEKFIKLYKPNNFIINGDYVDFYNLSKFEKDPKRKTSIVEELNQAKELLSRLNKALPPKCNKVFVHGNHENRLQGYLWKNPELEGLKELKLGNLLELDEFGFKEVAADRDYWKKDSGHYKVGDIIINHGDNRLNGAKTSAKSGYSAHNTMMTMRSSIAMGHIHRLALVYNTTNGNTVVGMEGGCLSLIPANADWQHGFITFESKGNTSYNHQIHKLA